MYCDSLCTVSTYIYIYSIEILLMIIMVVKTFISGLWQYDFILRSHMHLLFYSDNATHYYKMCFMLAE